MRRHVIGTSITLVFIGLWIWLSALGVPYISFGRNWPLLIVALGVHILVRSIRRAVRRRRSAADVITDLENGRIDADKAVDEIRRKP